jgi:hypothetical protein
MTAPNAATTTDDSPRRSSDSDGLNLLTRRRFFQQMVDRAFQDCDTSMSGEVDKNELYAGLLMVHLKLAKYAGPAACYVS